MCYKSSQEGQLYNYRDKICSRAYTSKQVPIFYLTGQKKTLSRDTLKPNFLPVGWYLVHIKVPSISFFLNNKFDFVN